MYGVHQDLVFVAVDFIELSLNLWFKGGDFDLQDGTGGELRFELFFFINHYLNRSQYLR